MSTFTAERDQYIAQTGGVINLGSSPEELGKLATAVASLSTLSAGQQVEIVRLTGLLDTSEGIVRAVLVAIAEHLGAIAPEALPEKIAALAAERRDLLARQAERAPEADAVLADLDRAIAEAMTAGDDLHTQALLERRRDLKKAAASHRGAAAERLREAEARDLRDAAESEASLGDLALARLRYREAAARFRAAAELLPPGEAHRDVRLAYGDRAADALFWQGDEFGDNAALLEAVAAYRAALQEHTRERVPLDWAMTQNNLGNALCDARGARERHGAAGGGGRRLPRRAGGADPRAGAARLGDDAEQPRQRAPDARGARERHGAAGGGGRRLPRRAGGADPRARAARLGDDAEQPRQRARGRSASGRAARRGWRRRSPPTAPRWRSGPASGCRSTGR